MAQRLESRRRLGRFRHWKQAYKPGEPLIWSRTTEFGDTTYQPGDPIPQDVVDSMSAGKLFALWETKRIELADWVDPDVATGQVATTDPGQTTSGEFEVPEGVIVSGPAGGWYTISDGEAEHKERGKDKVLHVLEQIRETRAAQAEAEAKAKAEAEAEAKALADAQAASLVQNDKGGSAPGNGEE